MRTQLISSTTVTYPNSVIWLHDSNVIKLDSSYPVGAEITVTAPDSESKTLVYKSDFTSLSFFLNDTIAELYGDSLSYWTIRVRVFENTSLVGTFNFATKVLNGRSFITRSHGAAETIYVYSYEDLYKVQLYTPANGQVAIGNWTNTCYEGINGYNLQSVLTSTGEYSICCSSSTTTPSSVSIIGIDPEEPTISSVEFQVTSGYDPNAKQGGDIWGSRTIFPICHKIIYEEVCDNFKFAELRYIDADGCTRFLGGKLISEVETVNDESWSTTTTEVYKHNPSRWIQSANNVIKVAFSDIERNAYPTDILYSDKIWMKNWEGEWKQVRLKTTNLTTTDEEYLDFELEVYTHEL